jgi:hypothetical protein
MIQVLPQAYDEHLDTTSFSFTEVRRPMSVRFHQVIGVAVVLGFVGPALAQGQCQGGKQGGGGGSGGPMKMSSTRMQGGPPNLRTPFNPPGQRTPFTPITSQRQIPLQTPLAPQLQMQIMLQQQLQQQQMLNQALLAQKYQLMQGVQAQKLASSQTDATLQHASVAHSNILVRQAALQEITRRQNQNGQAGGR